jgi:putative heme-binding domain-containing protein
MAPFLYMTDWTPALLRDTILGRLTRRYAAGGEDWGIVHLLRHATQEEDRRIVLAALDEGTKGRRADWFQEHFGIQRAITEQAEADPTNVILARLQARMGKPEALERVRAIAFDALAPGPRRLAMLDLLRDLGDRASLDPLMDLATGDEADTLRFAALTALSSIDDDHVAARLLVNYASQSAAWRTRAREVLLSRKAWAGALLDSIGSGRIDPKDVSLDHVGRVALFQDDALNARVAKLWGRVAGPTPEEKLAEVRRLNNDLRAAGGDATKGRELFRKHCATCHRLNGDGNLIGPELTGANRSDRDWLLVSLVDPSGIVRKEYAASLVNLKDGRVLTGLLAEDSPGQITLVDARAERTILPRGEIESIADSPVSLMPEDLYRELSPQDLRDLFAYLQAP